MAFKLNSEEKHTSGKKEKVKSQPRCEFCTGECVVSHKHGLGCRCGLHVTGSCPLSDCRCHGRQ